MREILMWIVGGVLVCVFIYAMYWVAKTGSYFFFYEDMVQDTIREMVKQEYLK